MNWFRNEHKKYADIQSKFNNLLLHTTDMQ
jgi:hypothetical protein